MGRKQKLRRDKQAARRKREDASTSGIEATKLPTAAAAATRARTPEQVPSLIIPLARAIATAAVGAYNTDPPDDYEDDKDEEDDEFPKSEQYLQAEKLLNSKLMMSPTFYDKSMQMVMQFYMKGATQHGCIHSMIYLGIIRSNPNLYGTLLHLAHPWFLEGAIRGSRVCARYLIDKVYSKAYPHPPKALQKYWGQWIQKLDKQTHHENEDKDDNANDADDGTRTKLGNKMKVFTADINRKCSICKRIDSDTVTLRQCMGCSTYCYCSEYCQTVHWSGVCNHKNECKHLQILVKYHKPYAKEIRLAAIQHRETATAPHPALVKLRHKLGLTRPTIDYEQLKRDTQTEEFDETQQEKPKKDPVNYLVARPDGTVWIGSPPTTISQ